MCVRIRSCCCVASPVQRPVSVHDCQSLPQQLLLGGLLGVAAARCKVNNTLKKVQGDLHRTTRHTRKTIISNCQESLRCQSRGVQAFREWVHYPPPISADASHTTSTSTSTIGNSNQHQTNKCDCPHAQGGACTEYQQFCFQGNHPPPHLCLTAVSRLAQVEGLCCCASLWVSVVAPAALQQLRITAQLQEGPADRNSNQQ